MACRRHLCLVTVYRKMIRREGERDRRWETWRERTIGGGRHGGRGGRERERRMGRVVSQERAAIGRF